MTYVSNDVTRIREVIQAVSADTTLTAADSGKVFTLDATGEAITLPAVSDGVNFKFVSSVAATGSSWTVAATAAVIYGSIQLAGAISAVSAKTTITLVADKFLPGDFIELVSDGTNWYLSGSIVTAAGMTVA